jgi:hypothetical protein
VPNELRDTTGDDLAAALGRVDAVVTTPSTAVLESMLQGVPVALLDYSNSPQYVPAAWTISAPQHLDEVLPELVRPPEPKRLFQDAVLHDALECRTPAAPRLAYLIAEMARIGRECRERGDPLRFPRRILRDDQDGHQLPEERFDLAGLYPDHPVFANMDRAALQVELGHAAAWYRYRVAESCRLRGEAEAWRGEAAALKEVVGQLRHRSDATADRQAEEIGRLSAELEQAIAELAARRALQAQMERHPVLGRLLRLRRRLIGQKKMS